MEESAREDVNDVLRLLYDEGLTVNIPEVIKMVEKELEKGLSSSSWMFVLNTGAFSDEHLVYGALSEMVYPVGTFVAPIFIAKYMEEASRLGNGTRRTNLIKSVAEKLKPTVDGHEHIRYCVPVVVNEHWGLCVAEANAKNGAVYWGDSLGHRKEFSGVANVLAETFQLLLPDICFELERPNLMLTIMKLVQQTDGFSCGFYVVSTIASYALGLGCLEGYGYSQKCSSIVTENMRIQAFKCYFQRAMEACQAFKEYNNGKEGERRFTESHVFRHIYQNRLGHVFPKVLTDSEYPPPFTYAPRNGILVSNHRDYIADMNKGGAEFRVCENGHEPRREQSSVEKVMIYSCHRENNRCPAKIYFYFMKDRQIIAVRACLHSHTP